MQPRSEVRDGVNTGRHCVAMTLGWRRAANCVRGEQQRLLAPNLWVMVGTSNTRRIMREAVIVSTARTPIGKAYRGALNNLEAPSLGGHAIRAAVSRSKIDPAEIEDVIMGCALQEGSSGFNIARQCLIAAGLPVTAAGMSVDRQCSSGLMAIATAAKTIVCDSV